MSNGQKHEKAAYIRGLRVELRGSATVFIYVIHTVLKPFLRLKSFI